LSFFVKKLATLVKIAQQEKPVRKSASCAAHQSFSGFAGAPLLQLIALLVTTPTVRVLKMEQKTLFLIFINVLVVRGVPILPGTQQTADPTPLIFGDDLPTSSNRLRLIEEPKKPLINLASPPMIPSAALSNPEAKDERKLIGFGFPLGLDRFSPSMFDLMVNIAILFIIICLNFVFGIKH